MAAGVSFVDILNPKYEPHWGMTTFDRPWPLTPCMTILGKKINICSSCNPYISKNNRYSNLKHFSTQEFD